MIIECNNMKMIKL